MSAAVELRQGDERYPQRLLSVTQPPGSLWVLGNVALLARPAVAVVGTRRPTAYGRRTAEDIGRALAAEGVAVVSGLALGLDAAAHRGALAAGGATIAVLAGGVDSIYPKANAALYDAIVEQGLIVSEAPPRAEARGFDFPRRNRIIAGLAQALVVVEGRHKSGTAHTVEAMLGLGRPVFAVPGRLEDPAAETPNALIQHGADVYLVPGDVLASLGSPVRPAAEAEAARMRFKRAQAKAELGEARRKGLARRQLLGSDEATLFDVLGRDPQDVDVLARLSALAPAALLAALSSLELQGLVTQLPGKRFALAS